MGIPYPSPAGLKLPDADLKSFRRQAHRGKGGSRSLSDGHFSDEGDSVTMFPSSLFALRRPVSDIDRRRMAETMVLRALGTLGMDATVIEYHASACGSSRGPRRFEF